MIRTSALIVVAAALLQTTLAQPLPPLFENGKSAWLISLPEAPTLPEEYAAKELQTTLQKISGVKLTIVSNAIPSRGPAIVIGTPATLPACAGLFAAEQPAAKGAERIVVKSDADKLLLVGDQPRAALYAVYSFLREELDCRWLWPGDDGEFLPSLASYTLPANLNRTFTTSFRYREMTPCYMHHHVPTEIWMSRNFLNKGSRTVAIRDQMGQMRGGGGHRVTVPKKLFETRPELFGVLNGERHPDCYSGCWSNPDFTDYVVDAIVKYTRKNNLELLNIFPADITHRCECDKCTVIPDKSARWYNYYALLIGRLREHLPDVTFAGIAYQEYRSPPEGEVHGLDYVMHCQYSRCYIHKFDNPECKLNQKTLAQLNVWREKVPMGIYGYEFDIFGDKMYLPFWNMLHDEAKLFKELGLVHMKTEMSVRYPAGAARHQLPQQTHRLSNYLYAHLIWNHAADPDVLLADWCRHAYGPAAPHLLAYHRAMAAAWDAMSIHATYFGSKPDGVAREFLNDTLIASAKQHFAAADQALAGQAELNRYREEVAIEREFFDKWERIHRLASDAAIVLPLTLLEGDDSFAAVAPLPMSSKNGTHLPVIAKLYWSKSALHLQVDALGLPDWQTLPTDFAGRDISTWGPHNIELFLSDHKVSPFWHIAINPSGLIYDAIGTDKSWNPALEVKTELIPDGWRATLKIPFAALESTPKPGDQWQIVINRNGKPEASGFPFPSYHDIASGATILFSDNTNAQRHLAWISRPGHEPTPRFNTAKRALYEAGWRCQHGVGAVGARQLDLNAAKLIFIETYRNDLPGEFYREQLIPAVSAGAVALFESYFWIDKLPEHFDDPSFAVKFVENALTPFKTTYAAANSFATTPNDVWKTLKTAPSAVLEPSVPEAWETLLAQYNTEKVEKPYLIARPYGKGMVAVSCALRGNLKILENLLDYNSAIKRL